VIVPYVEFPPVILLTDQVTLESVTFLTVAVNCCVAEAITVEAVGEIVTDIPVVLPDELLLPLPPHARRANKKGTRRRYE
jgi:hypothetical protein